MVVGPQRNMCHRSPARFSVRGVKHGFFPSGNQQFSFLVLRDVQGSWVLYSVPSSLLSFLSFAVFWFFFGFCFFLLLWLLLLLFLVLFSDVILLFLVYSKYPLGPVFAAFGVARKRLPRRISNLVSGCARALQLRQLAAHSPGHRQTYKEGSKMVSYLFSPFPLA